MKINKKNKIQVRTSLENDHYHVILAGAVAMRYNSFQIIKLLNFFFLNCS